MSRRIALNLDRYLVLKTSCYNLTGTESYNYPPSARTVTGSRRNSTHSWAEERVRCLASAVLHLVTCGGLIDTVGSATQRGDAVEVWARVACHHLHHPQGRSTDLSAPSSSCRVGEKEGEGTLFLETFCQRDEVKSSSTFHWM